MVEINFKKIEKKWQDAWQKSKIFEVTEDPKKEKYYVLEMFPYPSGSGLHMGHAWNYTIGDILARFKIMQGFNVLHPMGYDALGLPAENAAIKENTHPEDYNKKSIANYIKQQKALGLTYDWTRMVSTDDSKYYKWDQWIFLKMFEKGLAYQKESAVNWCPKCNTVLANEQVVDGKCWRHEDTNVEIKHLKQWFLKITNYADELYENIDSLNWPDRTKAMQKNWIGKSHGTEIDFEIANGKGNEISNVVIVHGSPSKEEYALANPPNKSHWLSWLNVKLEGQKIKSFVPLMPECWNPNYNKWKKEFEKIRVDEKSVLIGHSAGGGFLVRWLGETKKKIKKLILVAPAISNKKEESWETQEIYNFEINKEVPKNVGEIIIYVSDDDENSILESVNIFSKELNIIPKEFKEYRHFTLRDMGTKEFPELLNEILGDKKWPIFTTRPDTIFGVTFMVISAQHPRLFDLVTKEQKKEVEKFLKKISSVSQKSMKDLDELNKEGVFTGSYAINPATNEKVPIYAGNFVVADYASGMVMAVPAHDQRDFEFAKKYGIEVKQVITNKDPLDFKKKYDGKKAFVDSGILMNSKQFSGMNSEEAKKEISAWLEKNKKARKVVNFKLRDWGISRQRYWGTPIPIIHCDKCGAVAVPEKDLPVELPKNVKFGKGNPLETAKDWIKVKCPKCGMDARRETDTMDTFVNSSWYFLRYCDPKNDKQIFDPKKIKYWCPIDKYIGGAEHACMHLIYFRFYTKFLSDLGLLNFREPAKQLFHQGMLRAEGGEKMSKSKGNVVLPETVSDRFGIDTARFFLSSLASPDKDIDWSDNGIVGSSRFVSKIVAYFETWKNEKDPEEILSKLNKTIKNVTDYFDNFEYRKATIELRELFDLIEKNKTSKDTLNKFLQLLNPICPHITEELWEKIGNKKFVSNSVWPKVDEKKIVEKNSVIGDLNEKIIGQLKPLAEKFVDAKKIYLYVMPFEISKIDVKKVGKAIGKEVKIFAVNDSEKVDPEGKAKKAKPGMPSFYFE